MARHACGGILHACSLLLCVLMVVTAVGCGGSGDSASSGASEVQALTSSSSSSDSESSSSAGSVAVTLNWTEPTTNTNGTALTDLTGYTIQYGTSAASLSEVVNIDSPTTTSYTVQNLTPGTWYFGIVATASDGTQSTLSNVVSTQVQ